MTVAREQRDQEFSDYVAQRRPHLKRIAYLLCGDAHRADDLVQGALLKLYVAWPKVRRMDSVDGYVRRMLVNSQIDESRRPWRREAPGLDGHDRAEGFDGRFEDRPALAAALAALPAGQRRVVVLRHYVGLSTAETAADLRLSTGTVKSQNARALARLGELLAAADLH